ncbi:MAG: recombinase family protein [Rickettsiales bacterium]|nr:recombinase family protein [Rickettsiales bacterium]
MNKKIGYARCSTDRQTTLQQVAALEQAGCRQVFVDDGVSATVKNRVELKKARKCLREGDVFCVVAIDRAFRSTIEAIQFLDDLMKHGIAFQSLTQAIDTRTPEGRKWFIDAASWAEYERAMISRRTKDKMAFSKAQGQHLGRPFKLSECRIRCAHRLITQKGWHIDDAARLCRVSPLTLRRGFRRLELDTA